MLYRIYLTLHAVERLIERFPKYVNEKKLKYEDLNLRHRKDCRFWNEAFLPWLRDSTENRTFQNDTRTMIGLYERYGFDAQFRFFDNVEKRVRFVLREDKKRRDCWVVVTLFEMEVSRIKQNVKYNKPKNTLGAMEDKRIEQENIQSMSNEVYNFTPTLKNGKIVDNEGIIMKPKIEVFDAIGGELHTVEVEGLFNRHARLFTLDKMYYRNSFYETTQKLLWKLSEDVVYDKRTGLIMSEVECINEMYVNMGIGKKSRVNASDVRYICLSIAKSFKKAETLNAGLKTDEKGFHYLKLSICGYIVEFRFMAIGIINFKVVSWVDTNQSHPELISRKSVVAVSA